MKSRQRSNGGRLQKGLARAWRARRAPGCGKLPHTGAERVERKVKGTMESKKENVILPEDGEYTVEVTLEGGSGRAQITSPAELIIEDGEAYARIEWSSSHYDYMKVEEEMYLPVNEEGNSVFEIPVTVFDEPVEILAETTAMSRPHEVEYTLTFSSESISSAGGTGLPGGVVWAAALILAAAAAVCLVKKRKKES